MEMIKVCSSAKMEEEEVGDDGELSLELSIGTKSYKKANPLPQKKIILGLNCWDVSRPSHDCPGSKFDLRIEPCPPKQDMQALRRKKRDEKLQLASSSSSSKQGHNGNKGDDDDDEMPPRKKEKSQGSRCNNVFPNFGQKEDVINKEEEKEESYWNHRMIDHGSGSTCPSMQYVSFTTGGCGYPYASISSCFGNINGIDKDKRVGFDMANDGLEKEKRVGFEMVASQSFRPYSRDIDGNRKSDCSSGGSSSALSDHHNSSHQGGNSSINITQDNQNAAENSEIKCWDSMGMGEVKVKTKADQSRVNVTSSTNNNIQVRRSICNEEPKVGAPLMEPVLSNKKAIFAALLKKESNNNINVITNIPAQPKCPQMPCVSTTGNGPNGKTIMGFLYSWYTKTEVCIVCVCHGTSFSPAEFVKHAGGVDVEHPLRHITVVRTI